MIHPYNYDPWVYKFSRDAMGPHSQHIDDDPEDSRPKSKEELAGTPEAIAKKEAADAEEKKMSEINRQNTIFIILIYRNFPDTDNFLFINADFEKL